MADDATPLYDRVLLKLSGEALAGDGAGLQVRLVEQLCGEIASIQTLGVQLAVVVGGGNFCRGRDWQDQGFDAITCDQIGMLATLMNALVLRDALLNLGVACRIMSAVAVTGLAQAFDRKQAIAYLDQQEVVIFAGGTGHPLVTTDTAASLRSIEIQADVLLKATQVDGVYSADPKLSIDASRYTRLSFTEVLANNLAVMDKIAFYQCQQHQMPIRVFNVQTPGMLLKVMFDESLGTLIQGEA